MEKSVLTALCPLATLLTREKNRVARAVEFWYKKKFEKQVGDPSGPLQVDLNAAFKKISQLEERLRAIQLDDSKQPQPLTMTSQKTAEDKVSPGPFTPNYPNIPFYSKFSSRILGKKGGWKETTPLWKST